MAVRWTCESVTSSDSSPVCRLLHRRSALFCQWCLSTRQDMIKTRPCDKIEDTGSNQCFFMLLPLAFLPPSAYFHVCLIFSLFLPLFFDKSLSGWNNGVLCTETHEKENLIIEIFITCCANANYGLYLLRLSLFIISFLFQFMYLSVTLYPHLCIFTKTTVELKIENPIMLTQSR